MSTQTSYLINHPKAYAGMVFAQAPHDIVSRDAEGEIAFGVAVSRGTDKDRQTVKGGTSFTGISIRSLEREGSVYADKETVGVLRDGYVWITCPSGCNPGDLVKYVNATGVIDSGAPAIGETALDGAQWDTTAVAGELAVLRLNSLNTTAGA